MVFNLNDTDRHGVRFKTGHAQADARDELEVAGRELILTADACGVDLGVDVLVERSLRGRDLVTRLQVRKFTNQLGGAELLRSEPLPYWMAAPVVKLSVTAMSAPKAASPISALMLPLLSSESVS